MNAIQPLACLQADTRCLLPLQSAVRAAQVQERCIVIGCTTDGFEEAAYHSVMDSAAEVMRHREPRFCMLWNLSWRMDSQLAATFSHNVLEYGHLREIFTTCELQPLWQIVNIVYSIKAWIQADERHVAFIHCLHAQRLAVFLHCLFVGTTVAAGLLQSIRPNLVLPASHARYIEYYRQMAESMGHFPDSVPIRLKRVLVSGIPGMPHLHPNCAPRLAVYQMRHSIYYITFPSEDFSDTIQVEPNLTISGDIVIQLQIVAEDNSMLSVLFRYALHTGFWRSECNSLHIVDNSAIIRVRWDDLDIDASHAPFADQDTDGFFMELILENTAAGTPVGAAAPSDGDHVVPRSTNRVSWPSYYLTSALRQEPELQTHRLLSGVTRRFGAVRLNPAVRDMAASKYALQLWQAVHSS